MLAVKKLLTSSFLAVFLSVAVVNTALAEPITPHNPEMTVQLKAFRSKAAAMRDDSDSLKSMTMNKRLTWQSHTDRLAMLKKHVNEMGKSLAALEDQKVVATEGQAMATKQARLHL